jgi:uncharacterized membrane protein YhaH (DUF805 family)
MVEAFSEAAASLGRTIGRTFVFAGRSRRLDLGHYWIASMLVAVVSGLAVEPGLDPVSAMTVSKAIELALVIPFFALFARRLHDQGRSAWWTLALPPLAAANIYDHLRVNFHAFDPAWPDLGMWKLLLLPVVLGSLAVMVFPGHVGANRYGGDPRLDEREPEAV